MKLGKRLSILSVFVLVMIVTGGCGHSSSPPQLTSENLVQGSWNLQDIRCNGQATSTLTDQMLAQKAVGMDMVINGDTGSRVWILGGCTLTVPLTKITYAVGQLTAQEGAASCQEAKSGDCAPFAQQCAAPGDTANYPVTSNSSLITLQIPPQPAYMDPCNSQWKDTVTFTMGRM